MHTSDALLPPSVVIRHGLVGELPASRFIILLESLARIESYFSIYMILSLSVDSEVRTHCCLDRNALTKKTESNLAGRYQFFDFSFKRCTSPRERQERSRRAERMALTFQSSFPSFFYVCPFFLGLHSNLVHHLFTFLIHFHPFPSFFFGGSLLLHWTQVPNLNHQLSVCHVGNTFILHTLDSCGVSVGARISPHSSNYHGCSHSLLHVHFQEIPK